MRYSYNKGYSRNSAKRKWIDRGYECHKRCVNSMAKRQGNINSFSNVFDFDNAFRSYLSPLTCAGIDVDLMPDFGVEGIEVNGIRFSSEGFFYFGAIGFDYGCGFMVSLVKDIPDFTNLSLLRNKSAVSISLNSSLNNKEFFKQQFSSSIPFFRILLHNYKRWTTDIRRD